jgi:hypothetical protein
MSADWSKPISTTLYTSVLSIIDERLDDVAKMFNGLSPTNLPTGAFRIDGSSNNLLQTYNGATWDNQGLSIQTLKVGINGANAAATVTDIELGGDANLSAQGDLNLYIDSDNNDTTAAFNWYKNSNDTTGAALLMTLSEAGVLSGVTFSGTVTTNANLVGQVTSVGNTATMSVTAITSQTLMGTAIIGTDELMISDGGVLKRSTFTRVATYIAATAQPWTAHQTFNDNIRLKFGSSGGESELFSDGANTIWELNGVKDLHIFQDAVKRFVFDSSAGDFHAGNEIVASSTTVSSDPRLKENITSIQNALNKVNALNGVTFTWKGSGEVSAGLISTDVMEVLPEAVKVGGGEFDEVHGQQRVNYNATIGLLVEAVKELAAKVESLEEQQ